jgi:LuxR family maltose regulon positive regulatory protein
MSTGSRTGAWAPIRRPHRPPRPRACSRRTCRPRLRAGHVRRTRLLRRLRADRDHRIVSVVAPPGYGKTSFLVQLTTSGTDPVAWLTVDDTDHDPVVVLGHLAAALDVQRGTAPAVDVTGLVTGAHMSSLTIVARLLGALRARAVLVLIIIDDVHRMSGRRELRRPAQLISHGAGRRAW